MTRPVVSELAEHIYESMEPFARLDGEGTDWALLRYIDSFSTSMLGTVYDIVRDRDDQPGWVILFDPDNAPVEALPYLAQFVGATLTDDMSEADRRAEIRTPSGWKRGTLPAFIAAIKRTLDGEQLVLVEERWTGDAYKLWVRTLDSETPDQARTLAAINAAKPMGLVLTYQAVISWAWSDVDDDYATWAALVAGFATWNDVLAVEP